jgi:hypothetical protein
MIQNLINLIYNGTVKLVYYFIYCIPYIFYEILYPEKGFANRKFKDEEVKKIIDIMNSEKILNISTGITNILMIILFVIIIIKLIKYIIKIIEKKGNKSN